MKLMKLVLLFFCAIFGLVVFVMLILIKSTLRLNVAKLDISNFENGFKKDKLEKDILIYLEIYLFGKMRITRINISKDGMFSKLKPSIKLSDLKRNKNILKETKIGEIVKMSKLEIDKAYLDAQIGTEDIMTTVFGVSFLSSIARDIIQKCKEERCIF